MTMTPSEAEIESIVRRVVERLRADSFSDIPSATTVTPSPDHHLDNRLISLETCRALSSSSKTITIAERSVVTPAAKDWLKERGIAWSRLGRSPDVRSKTHQTSVEKLTREPLPRLHICGSTAASANMARSICSKMAIVEPQSVDDSTALRQCQSLLRGTSRIGILIVQAAHATCWQAARDDQLRPVVVTSWSCLEDILQQVPANLFLFGSTDWTLPGLANSIRRIHRTIQMANGKVAHESVAKGKP